MRDIPLLIADAVGSHAMRLIPAVASYEVPVKQYQSTSAMSMKGDRTSCSLQILGLAQHTSAVVCNGYKGRDA